MSSILLFLLIFSSATGWIYFITTLAPVEDYDDDSNNTNTSNMEPGILSFPSNLEDLKQIGSLLNNYSKNHPIYVFVLYVNAYLYKQTFAIPGSVFLNMLSGALFGICWGFPLTCLLSASGASLCYLLSKLCGRQMVINYFPQKVQHFQEKVEENRGNLFYFMLFLRLFPMSPNWLINIASPIVNVPLRLFFTSVFFGLMPYNFICVQTGVVLLDLKSIQNVFSYGTLIKLASMAFVALIPALVKNYTNRTTNPTPTSSSPQLDTKNK